MGAEFQVVQVEITPELSGERLDAALARLLPAYSRSRVTQWIRSGAVTSRTKPCRPSRIVYTHERFDLRIAPQRGSVAIEPEQLPLSVVFADAHCIVIDKQAGLVVHPGAGNACHTLQNALLGYDASLAHVPRAGIVHRLDKETSGLLLVARTAAAFAILSKQLAARSVRREYIAVCAGVMTGGGEIRQPIGRHRTDRVRMSVRSDGREAVTHYRVLARFRAHTLVRVQLETGRTHQIRVHLAHAKYPIVGDPVYGGRMVAPRGASKALLEELRAFKRQALHAATLAFDHPTSAARLSFDAELPADMQKLIGALRADLVSDATLV